MCPRLLQEDLTNISDNLFIFLIFQRKATDVRARRSDLKKIEDLGAILEEHLILDNRYTEHSTVSFLIECSPS